MKSKDLLMALSEVRQRLYHNTFTGQQLLAIADCIRILDATMAAINQEPSDQDVSSKE